MSLSTIILLLYLFLHAFLCLSGGQRLICQPEDATQEKTVLSDEVVQVINSLIDSKMAEMEEKIQEKLWKRMMDMPEVKNDAREDTEVTEKPRVCDLEYRNRCFSFDYSDVMTFAEAEDRCGRVGGHMANIYSKEHDDLIVDVIRKEGKTPFFFFIGMKYNSSTKQVFFHNGSLASYSRWYPDGPYPQIEHSLIRFIILPTSTGMFNNVEHNEAKSNGVLCEVETSTEI